MPARTTARIDENRYEPGLLGFIHVPEYRRRRAIEHTGQLLAPNAGRKVLSERNVGDLFKGTPLNLGCDFFLLVGRAGAREGVTQLFHAGVFRPAGPTTRAPPAVQGRAHDGVHDVGDAPIGEEHVPAAVLRRLLAGEHGVLGLPVHGLHGHLEAGLTQQLRRNDRLRLERDHIGRREHNDGRTVIAGFGQQLPGLRDRAAPDQAIRSGLGRQRRVAAKEGAADLVELRISDQGVEHVLLVHRHQGRTAHLDVVEWRMKEVHPADGLETQAVQGARRKILVGLQDRYQIERRPLQEIDVAGLQRVGCGLRVRHRDPLDAIDFHHLAARGPARRFGARHIILVLLVDGFDARLEFRGDEFERTRADLLGDRGARWRVGKALRHHEGDKRGRLAQRLQHQAVGLLQFQRDRPGVGGREAGGEVHQLLAHAVDDGPALQRRDAVLRGDRRAVMPFQSVAQGEGVRQLVVRHLPVRHLRPDGEARVHRHQSVVDHVTVVARDVGRRDDRVERAEVRVHHRPDGLGLRQSGPRQHCRNKQPAQDDCQGHRRGLGSQREGHHFPRMDAERTASDGARIVVTPEKPAPTAAMIGMNSRGSRTLRRRGCVGIRHGHVAFPPRSPHHHSGRETIWRAHKASKVKFRPYLHRCHAVVAIIASARIQQHRLRATRCIRAAKEVVDTRPKGRA